MGFGGLTPSIPVLLVAIALDAIFGDPHYPFHPVRLIGKTLMAAEKILRLHGWDGYGGGCVLFLFLSATWVILPSFILLWLYVWSKLVGVFGHILLVYALLALRDLIDHVWAVQSAARREDLIAARDAAGLLVGRDTSMVDFAACRRAAIESLSENFVDGFLASIF